MSSNSNSAIIFTYEPPKKWPIAQVGRVFTNGPGHQGSIPDRVKTKDQKMFLDASLLNTQHYKVCFKGKME